jgi:hypothetical protein
MRAAIRTVGQGRTLTAVGGVYRHAVKESPGGRMNELTAGFTARRMGRPAARFHGLAKSRSSSVSAHL